MKFNNSKVILRLFIGVLILWTAFSYSFAYIMGNFSECAFNNSCETGSPTDTQSMSNTGSTSTINYYVIDGAGYFTKAHSDTMLFLNRIEMSGLKGIDYNDLQEIINRAIVNMQGAKMAYILLTELAKTTPYNPAFIQRLVTFDYDNFKGKNKLNAVIFKDVERYLSRGDVRGFYSRLLSDIEELANRLSALKAAVDSGIFPAISDLWRLNEKFYETLMFGQYASEVFLQIKF